jgi:hypothetical protein
MDVICCFCFLSSLFILHPFPLMFRTFCIQFMSFHVAFISFHFAFMSFYVRSLCIKDIGLRKLICPNHLKPVRWVSAQTLTFFFHISLSFLLSFSYRFGGLCRLPSLGFMNMYMYISWLLFFYSYHFLGRQ